MNSSPVIGKNIEMDDVLAIAYAELIEDLERSHA